MNVRSILASFSCLTVFVIFPVNAYAQSTIGCLEILKDPKISGELKTACRKFLNGPDSGTSRSSGTSGLLKEDLKKLSEDLKEFKKDLIWEQDVLRKKREILNKERDAFHKELDAFDKERAAAPMQER